MSGSDSSSTSRACAPPPSDALVDNAPGLSAIAYRIGTHPSILRRMLERLPLATVEPTPGDVRHPLAALTTRATDDPAIALLDAWACLADVLTFYQERLANEGFLRTATERRSILELSRLIGYELNPGVAASVHLTYTVDTAAGASAAVTVPAGSRVQSVPGQGELPQTFETSADAEARAEWNSLRPRLKRPQALVISGGGLYALALAAGEDGVPLDAAETAPLDAETPLPVTGEVSGQPVETIYAAGTSTGLKGGDVILLVARRDDVSEARTLVRTIRRVDEDTTLDRTRIDFEAEVPPTPAVRVVVGIRAIPSIRLTSLSAASVDRVILGQSWSDRDLTAWLGVQGWDRRATLEYIRRAAARPPKSARLAPGAPGMFAMRARAGFFGHNAPAFATMPEAPKAFVDWDAGAGLSVWQESRNVGGLYESADCFLDRAVPGITADSWAVFERPARQFTPFRVATAVESSLAGYGLSGKATGLRLANAADGDGLADTDKPASFSTRGTTAHVASERLALALMPIDEPIGRGTPESASLTLDRMVLDLRAGQHVVVTGDRHDLDGVAASEVVTLDRVEHVGGFTHLHFSPPGLVHPYVRHTVALNANVAHATHGERVAEVLGSGNAAAAAQRFTLRKAPLTHTSAPTDAGSVSALDLRVDGVRWTQKGHLLDEGPDSESYQVRISDEGKAEVIFGDGEHGARLPTGVENVEASYRTGLGSAGMVGPDRLTLLMSRPLGIRSVTNPVAATGAADPESRDAARAHAPQTIQAMGRIVSRQDAEHFASAFAGIGKARARTLWRAGAPWLHLTVAADAAAPDSTGAGALADHRVEAGSTLARNLADAIARSREPGLRIRLDTYLPVFFNVSANVLVDDRFAWADVSDAIRAALDDAFSFRSRGFAEPVHLVHVIRVAQRVPGVVLVDVDALHRFDQPPDLPPDGRLVADDVVWADADPAPASLAHLLLLNPLGVTLTQLPSGTVTP